MHLARPFVRILSVALIGAMGLALPGCAAFTRQHPAAEQEVRVTDIQDIDVTGAYSLSRQGVTVIDVREPHEYQAGHVPGARNLPLGQLDTWAETLDSEGAYVVICRSGKRSAKATQGLEAKGFKNLRNVTGGMLEWEAQKLPVTQPE